MKLLERFRLVLDPTRIFDALGHAPDPWQRELLFASDRQILLNCCRQAGKSTAVAALALHQALFRPGSLILLLSRAQRQAFELFRKVREAYGALGRPIAARREAQTLSKLELANDSRVIGLPGKEATIRSYSGVDLLIIDEASRVPDELYYSVRPMLAVSQGRLICLSTPFGQRGFFYQEWIGGGPWKRIAITYRDCPRISEAFVAEEARAMGKSWVDQEYRCLFTAMEGLVYPEFGECVVHGALRIEDGRSRIEDGDSKADPQDGDSKVDPQSSILHPQSWILHPQFRKVGGLDFGFRNPFAAVWGVLDRDDVLHILGERYQSATPLHEHAAALPKGYEWYADPAGRTEIEELRAAGHKVLPGQNDIRLGIAAVTARIRTGRLKVWANGCPNLCREARRYRYATPSEHTQVGENPIDADNHALAALRYLISRIDAHFLAKLRGRGDGAAPRSERSKPWLRLDNEEIFSRLG